jgi:hypothetical protein
MMRVSTTTSASAVLRLVRDENLVCGPQRLQRSRISIVNVRRSFGVRSKHIQVMTGHKTATIGGTHLTHQVFLRRLGELIALVIEDQKARTRSRRQFAELSRRRVICAAHPLPFGRRLRVTSLRIDFM